MDGNEQTHATLPASSSICLREFENVGLLLHDENIGPDNDAWHNEDG